MPSNAAGALSDVTNAGESTTTMVRAWSLMTSSLDVAPIRMNAGLPLTLTFDTVAFVASASMVVCTRPAAVDAST
jgi:hypothetical protein